jgi:hypothetical protein
VGVVQDYALARAWFQKAADQGRSGAQDFLGKIYSNGYGVPQDYALARAWFKKAADQSNPAAYLHLGDLYARGLGVPQDNAQAIAFYQKAAELYTPANSAYEEDDWDRLKALQQATTKLQASGVHGPKTIIVQTSDEGSSVGAGGGLAGTTWACTDVLGGNTSSFLKIFGADGTMQYANPDGTGLGDSDQTWEQSGTQLVFRGPGDEGTIWTGTVSGNSIVGAYSDRDEHMSCTLQSGTVQSNSTSYMSSQSSVPSPSSSFGQSGSPNPQNAGNGPGSTAAARNSTSADAKVEGKPASSTDNPSDYVDPVPQCGHPQIEANTLYIVNECSFTVDAIYTSQGDIWGETPLAPGEHHRTAYSADAVRNVGGVSVYTCPGSGTAVDPAGNPIGLAPRYTGREYRCHR